MGISKVYKGYVIAEDNGAFYIQNSPNFTNGVPFSPGPHYGWTVATHQVDKLIDYLNRSSNNDRGKYNRETTSETEEYEEYYEPGNTKKQPFFTKTVKNDFMVGVLFYGSFMIAGIVVNVVKSIIRFFEWLF